MKAQLFILSGNIIHFIGSFSYTTVRIVYLEEKYVLRVVDRLSVRRSSCFTPELKTDFAAVSLSVLAIVWVVTFRAVYE